MPYRCRFHEVPGKPHWWNNALTMQAVEEAMKKLLEDDSDTQPARLNDFTLTVLWPRESGSLQGLKILETNIPGRCVFSIFSRPGRMT